MRLLGVLQTLLRIEERLVIVGGCGESKVQVRYMSTSGAEEVHPMFLAGNREKTCWGWVLADVYVYMYILSALGLPGNLIYVCGRLWERKKWSSSLLSSVLTVAVNNLVMVAVIASNAHECPHFTTAKTRRPMRRSIPVTQRDGFERCLDGPFEMGKCHPWFDFVCAHPLLKEQHNFICFTTGFSGKVQLKCAYCMQ